MPRKKEPYAPRVLYHLESLDGNSALSEAIDSDVWLDDRNFDRFDVAIDGHPALLVVGSPPEYTPEWVAELSQLTGLSVSLKFRGPGAALAFRIPEGVFAITFGQGRHLLRKEALAYRFGLSIALRAIDPDRITQITRTVMDSRAQTDRSSMSEGQSVRDFGIDGFGELVPKVVGKASGVPLVALRRKREVTVSGSDSLRLPLGRDAKDFVKDVQGMLREVRPRGVPADLQFVEEIKAVPEKEAISARLWRGLGDYLMQDDADAPIGISRPWHLDDSEDNISHYCLKGGKQRGGTSMDVVRLEDIVSGFRAADDGISWLRQRQIIAVSEDGRSVPRGAVPISNWIAAEVSIEDSRYFLHAGRWFHIGGQYARQVNGGVKNILERPSPVSLPVWTSGVESDYNEQVAQAYSDIACLDKRRTSSRMHRYGIETCDLLGPAGELIHVKGSTSSAPLSHLFAQAQNSAEQLKMEDEARRKFAHKVDTMGYAGSWTPETTPTKVIFGVKLKAPLAADSLFSFSKVMLLHTDRKLSRMGIDVFVMDLHPQRKVP